MINITTPELYEVLRTTPAEQNIMLVGRHGIGKSQILTHYFEERNMKVITLFLGQMSDPGDLIGLPTKNLETGKTDFMPPYWFPIDGKPIVLFLDELNRARPEVLQTVMDLCLNKKLAGRSLPKGSLIVSAVNDGEEYQLTDLDPALVSRFNVYCFRPTPQDWLLWAEKANLDSRLIDFIQDEPLWLDGNYGEDNNSDLGLEKAPDRRAWEKVSNIIKGEEILDEIFKKILAGIVGVRASMAFFTYIRNNRMRGKNIILDWNNVKDKLASYEPHQLAQMNETVFRFIESSTFTEKDTQRAMKSLPAYVDFLHKENKEAMAHFITLFAKGQYPKAVAFIATKTPEVYQQCLNYIDNL